MHGPLQQQGLHEAIISNNSQGQQFQITVSTNAFQKNSSRKATKQLTPYEQHRERNIIRNEAFLAKLNLLDEAQGLIKPKKRQRRKKKAQINLLRTRHAPTRRKRVEVEEKRRQAEITNNESADADSSDNSSGSTIVSIV